MKHISSPHNYSSYLIKYYTICEVTCTHTHNKASTPTDHPYYVAVQYHPEYLSRPLNPSPPYLGLILAAANKLNSYISRGCNISPRLSYDYTSGDDDEDDEVTQALSANSQ